MGSHQCQGVFHKSKLPTTSMQMVSLTSLPSKKVLVAKTRSLLPTTKGACPRTKSSAWLPRPRKTRKRTKPNKRSWKVSATQSCRRCTQQQELVVQVACQAVCPEVCQVVCQEVCQAVCQEVSQVQALPPEVLRMMLTKAQRSKKSIKLAHNLHLLHWVMLSN